MNKKILFIQPTIYDDNNKLVKKKRLYFVGLAYPLLAAMLPEDWEAEIYLETIEDIPFDTDADVIGIGGMGHAANRSKDIALEFKKRGKTVIMGGPMASLAPEIAKKYFDSIVIGDAEEIWQEVINDLENNRLKPFYKKQVEKLSTPLPRYDLIVNKKIGDFLPVQAGRGCPNSCKFCSIYCLYRNRYLKRDVAEVIRDIKYVKQLGFKKFLLIDDNIVSDENYMAELCTEIKKLKMTWMSQCAIDIGKNPELLKIVADSGCYTLSFGLESITQESLDHLGKSWCKTDEYLEIINNVINAGIEIASEMIVGVDTDTKESLNDTVNFVLNAKIIAPKFYIMTPIPGTDLYDEMLKENRIVEEDVLKFKPSRAVITHPHMTTQEITDMYWEIYNKLYTYKNIFKRTLLNKNFLKNPNRYLFFLMVNLYYRYQIKRKIAPNIM
ncbi:MAG: B12-binding domain-containing radical SAM protein [Candidatus Cloacimonetes bacterium]|nr:B12-binding domain-containing radical SAM protein [Candidatus Cloacimonadota bacterium]